MNTVKEKCANSNENATKSSSKSSGINHFSRCEQLANGKMSV